jgi:hypothetical protein
MNPHPRGLKTYDVTSQAPVPLAVMLDPQRLLWSVYRDVGSLYYLEIKFELTKQEFSQYYKLLI